MPHPPTPLSHTHTPHPPPHLVWWLDDRNDSRQRHDIIPLPSNNFKVSTNKKQTNRQTESCIFIHIFTSIDMKFGGPIVYTDSLKTNSQLPQRCRFCYCYRHNFQKILVISLTQTHDWKRRNATMTVAKGYSNRSKANLFWKWVLC